MNESQSRFPPSVFLLEELDARGWSLEKLCLEADLSVGDLEAVIAGDSLTFEIAQGIGKAFDTGPEVWLNLQKNFDADESRQAGSSRSA